MLELRDITAGYGDQVVLRDVSLVVPDAAVVALLGANGAGKTTLLRVASGMLAPSSGTLRVAGSDVTGWPAHKMSSVGVCHVPEGRGVFSGLSVRDNIRLQAASAVDLDAVEPVRVAFPRLGERLTQTAGTLSGGEQQMLALAAAYVAEPNLVLADEVSMGLAPKIVDEIYDHIRVLAARGVAILLVEQYVARALEVADFVYVLDKGRIVFVGEPDEVDEEQLQAAYLGVVA